MRGFDAGGYVLNSSEGNEVLDDLQTVLDWVRWGATEFQRAQLFFGHGTDNPWDDAALIVLWVIKTPWQKLEAIQTARLTRLERKRVLEAFSRRINERIPAAYITGEAYFGGLPFHVSENVLVPRSPMAELIESGFQPWLMHEPAAILDMCTGSGCIGIVCAMAFDEAEVHLSDISREAVEMAKRNVQRHQLEERVTVIESDIFEGIEGTYDLIVTNPPYVDAEDMANLPAEYQAEPVLALASGDDGLDFTRRFLKAADRHLNENGLIVVEVGNSWPALEAAYPSVGFTWLEFERGGHGVFVLTKEQLQMYKKELSGDYVG